MEVWIVLLLFVVAGLIGVVYSMALEMNKRIDESDAKFSSMQVEIDMLRGDTGSMQKLIDESDLLIQTQAEVINNVISLVDEYRNDHPRRIPWWKLAKAVGDEESPV